MSKEEFLKIQTCTLKVNIHCDGCKHKVKKILQKIDGVYTIKIDAEQGKVTVSGNLDPYTLIKKLAKSGKHAEIWGSKPINNFHDQFKHMQIDQGKSGNKNQKGGVNIPQLKGGGGGGGVGGPPSLQQLQQLQQQMKGFQDLKLPQLKDGKGPFKLPPNQNQNTKKSVKFESDDDDEDMTDDELGDFDEDDDEFDEEEDEFDDEDDESEDDMDDKHHQLNKMKPLMGNGSQGPNLMMMNGHGQAKDGGLGNPFGGANGKKGGGNGGGHFPVQINGNGKISAGGKEGGGPNGNTNGGNHGQGGAAKSGGKKNSGEAKNGNSGGGGESNNKNGHNGNGGGGPKKGGAQPMSMGHQMGNMSMPMGQMPHVHGRPAATMSAGSGDGGFSHGAGPLEGMGGNQHQQQQQQMAAAMMNQQRAMGNERFQPMMYARPPPAVNYAPPYPYPHPYPYQHPQPMYPPPQDSYTHHYSDDENTSSCNVM